MLIGRAQKSCGLKSAVGNKHMFGSDRLQKIPSDLPSYVCMREKKRKSIASIKLSSGDCFSLICSFLFFNERDAEMEQFQIL